MSNRLVINQCRVRVLFKGHRREVSEVDEGNSPDFVV